MILACGAAFTGHVSGRDAHITEHQPPQRENTEFWYSLSPKKELKQTHKKKSEDKGKFSLLGTDKRRIVFLHSGQVVAQRLSNGSLLAQLPPAHFSALTTGGSQQLMRHFISQSLIMAELQLQHEVEPQLLNGGDLNEEREDAEASESVKKKRRKKKRSKTSAPGERHHFAGLEDREGGEKKNSAEIVSSSATRCGADMRDRRLFSTCQRVSPSNCPNSAHLETGQSPRTVM